MRSGLAPQRFPCGIDRAGTYRLSSGKLDPNSSILILNLGQGRIRAMNMIDQSASCFDGRSSNDVRLAGTPAKK